MDDFSLERLCREIVAGSPEAIIFADRGGIIRFWNAGAAAMFGFGADEALGRPLDLVIPDNLRTRHWEGYYRVMVTGVTRYATNLLAVPALCRDGRRISVEFSMTLVRDDAGVIVGAAAIIRDVTSRWQKEKALREQLTALEARESSG